MKYLFSIFLFFLLGNLKAENQVFNPNKKFAAEKLRAWTAQVFNDLSIKHPGFYRYTTRARFNFIIDSTQKTIIDSLSELEYLRKLKPLFAQIGCLHTSITLSPEYRQYLEETKTLIPIEVFLDENLKVFVRHCYDSSQRISEKSELLSINGKPIRQVLKELFKTIPSDGFNQTEKVLLLNHSFASRYQNAIESVGNYEIQVVENGLPRTIRLNGVSKKVFPNQRSVEDDYDKALEFEIVDGTGILKVHSFANTAIQQKKGQNFRKYIQSVFERLNDEKVTKLVLDLRNNTGGTDANAVFLAAHFFDKTFRYWTKIEVTEAVAKEIKGPVKLFYKKPIRQDSTFLWQKSWLTREFNYYLPQEPAKDNFKGQTFILANGLCLSSCADVIAILSHNQKAKVIGQETGGAYQGNNSGMMPSVKIPTGLIMTVPLQRYSNAVDQNKNFGRGTMPDFEVTATYEDWVNKTDKEMKMALELLKATK